MMEITTLNISENIRHVAGRTNQRFTFFNNEHLLLLAFLLAIFFPLGYRRSLIATSSRGKPKDGEEDAFSLKHLPSSLVGRRPDSLYDDAAPMMRIRLQRESGRDNNVSSGISLPSYLRESPASND